MWRPVFIIHEIDYRTQINPMIYNSVINLQTLPTMFGTYKTLVYILHNWTVIINVIFIPQAYGMIYQRSEDYTKKFTIERQKNAKRWLY